MLHGPHSRRSPALTSIADRCTKVYYNITITGLSLAVAILWRLPRTVSDVCTRRTPQTRKDWPGTTPHVTGVLLWWFN